jgi:hypothetical protein
MAFLVRCRNGEFTSPAAGHAYFWKSIAGQDEVFADTVPWTLTFLAAGVLNPQDIAECYLVVGYVLEDA